MHSKAHAPLLVILETIFLPLVKKSIKAKKKIIGSSAEREYNQKEKTMANHVSWVLMSICFPQKITAYSLIAASKLTLPFLYIPMVCYLRLILLLILYCYALYYLNIIFKSVSPIRIVFPWIMCQNTTKSHQT